MRTWYSPTATRFPVLLAVLSGLVSGNGSSLAQPPESLLLVARIPAAEPGDETIPEGNRSCPLLNDPPLSALAVDIRPRDADGQLVPESDTPAGCWEPSSMEGPTLFMGGAPVRRSWGCHDLLQLARFYHRPLYFEDAAVERYGLVPSCPAVHSVAKFACDLLLFPGRLIVQHPHSCVRTPTPHCCAPCNEGCRCHACRD